MKKILPLILSVVLIFVLTVPAFADILDDFQRDVLTYGGYITANDGIKYPVRIGSTDTKHILRLYHEVKAQYGSTHFLIGQDGNVTYLYVCKFTVYNEDDEYLTAIQGGKYDKYRLSRNTDTFSADDFWAFNGTFTLNGGESLLNYDKLILSSDTITNRLTGGISVRPHDFFQPISLPTVVGGVTKETLETKTSSAISGTMLILTLCGVGLMALLVVLKLFGKLSLISRR